jgi:hypothetical protein
MLLFPQLALPIITSLKIKSYFSFPSVVCICILIKNKINILSSQQKMENKYSKKSVAIHPKEPNYFSNGSGNINIVFHLKLRKR